MNILILRKSSAFIGLHLFWNLSDRLNRGAKQFSVISPDSGVRIQLNRPGSSLEGPQGDSLGSRTHSVLVRSSIATGGVQTQLSSQEA